MENQINEDMQDLYDENAAIEEEDEDDAEQNINRLNRIRERRNIQDNDNIYRLFGFKRRFIHFCFNEAIMLTFIPTLLYNIFWIITLKKNNSGNLINFDEIRWNIICFCIFVLITGIVFLLVPRIICGREQAIDDFSFLRIIGKNLITFVCSWKITNIIEAFFSNNNELSSNNKIYFWINLYYKLEYFYLIVIESIIAIILIAVVLGATKEFLRANL